MSDSKELDDDALPQLKELVNPHWTNRQHAFARQLRSDPTPAMRSLHQLWKRNKLTGSFSPECELARLLSVLAEGFVDPQGKGARRMISTVDSLGNELWKACIDAEFLLLLIDIIAHCELHTQPRSIFLTLLECINGFMMIWMMAAIELPAGLDFIAPELAKLAPKVPVPDAQGQTFLERSDEVCDAIWKAREYIICDSDGIEPDQEYVLSQMDRFVLSMDGLPKKSHGQNGWRHQKLAYLAMLTWTLRHPTSDSPKPGSFQDPTQAAMVSFVSVYGSVAKHLANVEQVVGFLADIVLKVGYGKIARRIREALDAAVHTLDPSAQGLDNILIVARIITFPKDDYPAIWNNYCEDPLLNDVARALRVDAHRRRAEIAKKQNRDRDLNDWHIAARQWDLVCEGLLYGEIAPEKIDARDVIFMFTHGIRCCFDNLSSATLEPGGEDDDCKEFADMFGRISDDFCQGIRKSLSGEEKGSLPAIFVDELRVASRDVWYPTLRYIRELRPQFGTNATYGVVSSKWSRFGEALGLNEAAERDRYELMRTRVCWWEDCTFNKTPSPKPLLTCKGCKEARYCSAACQRNDWKEGGHRVRCRRLQQT